MQHSLKNSCFGVSFRLKKEIDDTTVKDIRDISRLKKENEAVKDG